MSENVLSYFSELCYSIPMKLLSARFWSKVDVKGMSECWNWKASLDGRGYGQFNIIENKKTVLHRAHRLSWELAHEKKFPSDKIALHICDNTKCVNPHHLKVGTQSDNMQDCHDKGRWEMTNIPPRKDSCKKGHKFTIENTSFHTTQGHRMCRTCIIERRLKRDANGKSVMANHCAKGHEFTVENTYLRPGRGHRMCKACMKKKG